jgi:hypothetical protein
MQLREVARQSSERVDRSPDELGGGAVDGALGEPLEGAHVEDDLARDVTVTCADSSSTWTRASSKIVNASSGQTSRPGAVNGITPSDTSGMSGAFRR